MRHQRAQGALLGRHGASSLHGGRLQLSATSDGLEGERGRHRVCPFLSPWLQRGFRPFQNPDYGCPRTASGQGVALDALLKFKADVGKRSLTGLPENRSSMLARVAKMALQFAKLLQQPRLPAVYTAQTKVLRCLVLNFGFLFG